MNPILIYRKIEALFGEAIATIPLRFATDPGDLPEGPYAVCAASTQAMSDLEGNHTAEATIEFSLVIPISSRVNRLTTEDAFSVFLNELYTNLFPEALNDADDGEDPKAVFFYSVVPDSVSTPEYDEFRITQRVAFKAEVQF